MKIRTIEVRIFVLLNPGLNDSKKLFAVTKIVLSYSEKGYVEVVAGLINLIRD